jgi:tRNA-splicing ligase RtcB
MRPFKITAICWTEFFTGLLNRYSQSNGANATDAPSTSRSPDNKKQIAMPKQHLRGKDLIAAGFPEGPVISVAMSVMANHYKGVDLPHQLEVLKRVLGAPAEYVDDSVLGPIAQKLIPKKKSGLVQEIDLIESGVPFSIFGAEGIEAGALAQMQAAARLPISVSGALMPDAHAGYGLPIGGVLATENAVIPYGVGVDIGCRMCLSVFDIDAAELEKREKFFTRELIESTVFGAGGVSAKSIDHEILERPEFRAMPLLRDLQDKASKQLGTSGGGNHFAEWGLVEIAHADPVLSLVPGTYVGFLTHSGSRALGANIASHFTAIAKAKRMLPREAANLAWLTLDEEEGQQYWLAMNLAGDYASACHHVIHAKIAAALGRQPMRMVENHHNFAWKELHEGRELIVHRKGATPAGKGVLGIIPGSMTAPGFIVKGKGIGASVDSASHGAGRRMSRTAAINTITQKQMKEILERQGVKLIGGGLDEAPMAYKDIHTVMGAQQTLVDVLGSFTPKIVRMAGDSPKGWRKGGKGGKVIEGE